MDEGQTRARGGTGRRGTGTAAALVLALSAACASAPPPPPSPIAVEEPRGISGPHASEVEDGAASRLAPVPPARPPLPWIPPTVDWRPRDPAEGSALALRIRPASGGRDPLFVEADLDGIPIHLARTPDGWFGVGALPIGSAGPRLLSVRFGVGSDSAEERLAAVPVRERSWPTARLRIASRTRDVLPETRARLDRERARIRAAVERVTPEWLAGDGFDWPRRDRITSPFGEHRLFEGEVRSLHLGLDIAGRRGAPVRAAAAGRVALAGTFLLQGNAVYLDHGLGVHTAYLHLSRIEVVEGQLVERGERLGRVGATGRVTGPHLHWSLYVAGRSLDPRSALELAAREP